MTNGFRKDPPKTPRLPPTPVRFSEDELKIVDAAVNLEGDSRSQFIRKVVMDAAMSRIAGHAAQ